MALLLRVLGLLSPLLLPRWGADETARCTSTAEPPRLAPRWIEDVVARRTPTDGPLDDAVACVRRELSDRAVAAGAALP